ncbi:MAG: type I DNA topoisomerase [Defluviitaleaceae bacterium]|nr:type I DNA topoisomerase [Defluviitaleaceae bacterium]
MNLLIVESPAKAKTLKKFLGKTYKIEASIGHIKDLPKSKLGIDFENDYEPSYITIRGKGDILSKLKKEAKVADKIYLATDPDREGEAISWHLKNALSVDEKKIFRVTFNQITKDAVKNAIKEARDINMNLVDAQQARRILDRVVGYKISPLLWKKIKKKGLSAGRVQSVALRMICDREEEIENFIPIEYWEVDTDLKTEKGKFNAKLFSIKKDGKIIKMSDKIVNSEKDVDVILKELKKSDFYLQDLQITKKSRKPNPTFTTSTLQQEASKVFGFPTNKTMLLAQQLYEGVDIKGKGNIGLLTYVRTDSTRIANEAFESVKKYLNENFGDKYTPEKVRNYKNKSSAQDAHEGIRPTFTDIAPNDIIDSLSKDQQKIYRLIWQRFVASQMPDAIYETTTAKISVKDYEFRASDTKLVFDGFTKIYEEKQENEEKNAKLPPLEKNQKFEVLKINKHKHFTQPPARYNDASLVKTLEEKGIGRPSTYSSIITTLTARNYIIKEAKVFYSTELGEIINEILTNNFEQIVDIDFTAKMETSLDRIEGGEIFWKEILRDFCPNFEIKVQEAEKNIEEITIEDEKTDVLCDKCESNMVIKFGKFGKFLACPSFPDCKNTKPFLKEIDTSCPICGGKVFIRTSKKGRKFFSCEHNPDDCDFISWNKPTGDNCPKCNSFLVEKGTKKVNIVCSNDKCDFKEELKERSTT